MGHEFSMGRLNPKEVIGRTVKMFKKSTINSERKVLVSAAKGVRENAYSAMGGRRADDPVLLWQITAVLEAEQSLIDLGASDLLRPRRGLVRKADLETDKGLGSAERFFQVRSTDFTIQAENAEAAYNMTAYTEAKRRETACKNASKTLGAMREDIPKE